MLRKQLFLTSADTFGVKRQILIGLFFLLISPTVFSQAVGYNKGFFIETADQNFQLKFNGRVQPIFKGEKRTDARGGFNFQLRRAALSFTAVAHQSLTLSATLLHAPNPNYNNAQFASVTAAYQVNPALVITAGMVGLPLDLMTMMSTSNLLFVDPPLTATRTDNAITRLTVTHFSFGIPDGLGINLAGDIGKAHYILGLINGNEDNFSIDETNKKVSFGGNLALDILASAIGTHTDLEYSMTPRLTANLGFNYQGRRLDSNIVNNQETLSGATINRILTGTTGLQFRYKGFALTAEGYAKRTAFANRGNASAAVVPHLTLTDLGYYVTSGYFLVPKKIELAGTWSYIRREGPDNDSYQFGGGLNYYLHGRDLKLNLQYTRSTFYSDIIGPRNRNVNTVILGVNALF